MSHRLMSHYQFEPIFRFNRRNDFRDEFENFEAIDLDEPNGFDRYGLPARLPVRLPARLPARLGLVPIEPEVSSPTNRGEPITESQSVTITRGLPF